MLSSLSICGSSKAGFTLNEVWLSGVHVRTLNTSNARARKKNILFALHAFKIFFFGKKWNLEASCSEVDLLFRQSFDC